MTSLRFPARGLSTSPQTTTRAVVIFCHGSGDTGPGARSYVESVAPPTTLSRLRGAGVALTYPTAQPRPYRLAGGAYTHVWFDRIGGMEPSNPEDTDSVEESVATLNRLVDEIVVGGIPPERIALGGFSMGGGIALQAAARSERRLGAVFALSSYLCDGSRVWSELGRRRDHSAAVSEDDSTRKCALLSSPVFMAHGNDDDFVYPEWGERTAFRLGETGVDVRHFIRVARAGHELTGDGLGRLFEFLLDVLFVEDEPPPDATSM